MDRRVTPAEHLAQVQASFAQDDRLSEVMRAAVRHLHAFVAEVRPTRDEWFTAVQFLTEIGQMSDDRRQEFILLSDTLGVSTLVEMLNDPGGDGATEPTVFGPFHLDGAPQRAPGATIAEVDLGGEPLVVRGTVRDTSAQPISGARLDVWQAAPNGLYDVQDEAQPSINLRGIFTTDTDGRYELRTLRPVPYRIPSDGPVGRMLRATGRGDWRPAHIHFVVTAPDHHAVTTHIFDRSSPHLDADAVFGVRDSLVRDMDGGEVTFDPVLSPAR